MRIKNLSEAIMLAGIIMFIIGCYYVAVKAGIPYQDPPLELQIKYAINIRIGRALLKDGFIVFVSGGISRLLFQKNTK